MNSRPVFQWDYRDTINTIDTEQRVIYLFPRQNLEIIFCTTDGITVKFVLIAKCLELRSQYDPFTPYFHKFAYLNKLWSGDLIVS